MPEAPSAQPEAPSTAEGEELRVEEERNGVPPNRNWQTPYLQYLHRGELPLDRAEARRLGLYAPAKGVNSTQGRHTCPLRPCKQYPSPGRLLCGVWTSSIPCRRHPGASCTCWSLSTNSPSGLRFDP
jgi:hypothetical protein